MEQATTLARSYAPGIGDAVADRTINRIVEVNIPPKVISVELVRDDHVALEDQVQRYCDENDILMTSYNVRKGGRNKIEVDPDRPVLADMPAG